MNVHRLFTDDDAVSPVIGVILMVAITVILAAVIGAFVLNIGGDQAHPPQVSWDVGEDDQRVEFTHTGGDQISSSASLSASLDGEKTDLNNPGYSAGDTIVVTATTTPSDTDVTTSDLDGHFDNGNIVRIIWSADGNSETSVIGEHRLSDQP